MEIRQEGQSHNFGAGPRMGLKHKRPAREGRPKSFIRNPGGGGKSTRTESGRIGDESREPDAVWAIRFVGGKMPRSRSRHAQSFIPDHRQGGGRGGRAASERSPCRVPGVLGRPQVQSGLPFGIANGATQFNWSGGREARPMPRTSWDGKRGNGGGPQSAGV